MSVQDYGRVPFIAEKALRQHFVNEPADNRFRAAARLQQALHRERQGWPIGRVQRADGRSRKVGNYLSKSAAAEGVNFIAPEIAALAKRELAYREDNAMIDQARLWGNLLSSHPLVFNLVGPLKLDLTLATRVANILWPDFIETVTDILFEHSPGRRDPTFTNDRTAFDAFIVGEKNDGSTAFIAIETKFSENMQEPVARLRPRYDEVSRQSGLYRDPESPNLRAAPLQSLWREHMLAASMIENGLYAQGKFVLIAPAANAPVQHAADLYRDHLSAIAPAPVAFEARSLETVIAAIDDAGSPVTAAKLHERCADFSALDQFI